VNGVIYAIGGVSGSTVEAYDPSTDSWTTKAPMPTERVLFAVGVLNGVIYVAGGDGGPGPLSVVEAYDPSTNSWSTRASMPTARYGLAGGVVNNTLFAIGGTDANPVGMSTVEAYTP
jgi:N-acetylneuraminic acid mutarotase